MRKLLLAIVLAGAAAALACSTGDKGATKDDSAAAAVAAAPTDGPTESPKKTKQTWIYFTKNHNPGTGSGQYKPDCVATIGTERIGTQKGDTIIWHIRLHNGGNDDDKCDMLDLSKVSLRFKTDVMGDVMKKLTPTGMVIVGAVTEKDSQIGGLLDHHYQVYYEEDPAGPDPVVVVGCSSCGEPPEK